MFRKNASPPKDRPQQPASGSAQVTPRPTGPGRVPYAPAEAKGLISDTHFDERELAALGEMYRRYTTLERSAIPVERMRDIPETSVFPLFQRVAAMHNTDNSGDIEFGEFVRSMSALSPRATLEEKLQFAFRLFDMNETGRLESLEVCACTQRPPAAHGSAHARRSVRSSFSCCA